VFGRPASIGGCIRRGVCMHTSRPWGTIGPAG
jgi:hypothetical protein